MSEKNLPLSGIQVVDFSRVLAGPYCCTLLSMLGADVIKIESKGGDESRYWPPQHHSMGAAYMGINLNKRSIVVDLREKNGQQIAHDLIGKSDVVVENFRTGAMEKFGLDYHQLNTQHPLLVFASISAFGRKGARADDAGYEALMQAYTGVMNITGHPDQDPVRCGASFLDMSTGIATALGVVTALFQRKETGCGARVDNSLLQSAVGLMSMQLCGYLLGQLKPQRLGTAHPSVVPYQAYKTADGDIFIASANQNLWERLCKALSLQQLVSDPRFKDNPSRVQNREACLSAISQAISTWKTEPLLHALKTEKVPATRVNTMPEFVADGQAAAVGAISTHTDPEMGELQLPNLPFLLDGEPGSIRKRAPKLGEHSHEILQELGYAESKITQLFEAGIVQ